MQNPLKKKDLWPLIVGTIAAIGIIGSNSTGGITKTTREPEPTPAASATAAATAQPSVSAVLPSGSASQTSGSAGQPTTAASSDQAIRLVEAPSSVKAGDAAAVSIIGQPGVSYDIAVSFGGSTGGVSGMERKQADAEGRVTWQWRVPALSGKGTYTLLITGGGQEIKSNFTVN